jgi:diguanylate cyclase (GGDEF)-like protein/PAS domain S-box-containing protein
MLGYDPVEAKVDFNFITQTLHPDDLPDVLEAIQSNTEGQTEYYDREDRFLTKSGKIKWLLIRGKIVEYTPDDKPARMSGIVKDISEKKLHEEEIKYLSYHDTLTGLYNRAYFEKELKKYLKMDNAISVIMGDVNGLKIVNDAFGHEKGDQLLKHVAGILTVSCRRNDLIARFGGDEFAIILRGANEKTVSDVIGRIETECGKCEGSIIKPSIAIGTATVINPSRDASLLMKTAEENMYRNKLLVDKSAHSAIINSLKQALAEKDIETEEHAVRLSEQGLEIGRKMGLKNDELDQLALLAILHDIGKVAISDNILLKPGKLDTEEWEIMKQHPAIGYRIAKASPDLSHIAEAILSHHERYDGTGYPQGLKGENIPIISRIISVVDSFDAMTHKRPYKEAMPGEIALEELKRCSGSQFDPYVVSIFFSLKEQSFRY